MRVEERRYNSVCVVGLGNFGTALARVWLSAGLEVRGWTVEEPVRDDIAANGENAKYLPGVVLTGLTVSSRLEDVVPGADVVVLALPSSVVLSVVEDIAPLLERDQVVIDVAKGLSPDQRLISDVLTEHLKRHGCDNSVCVLMGPTIAPELARGVLTTALIAGHDGDLAEDLARRLSTETLRLSSAADPVGAEYWGAFKNVIALACGVADGLKVQGLGGDNLKAAIFTAGYAEAVRLLPQLGADPDTAYGPAGIGDLYVTATSAHGRNREMGERLGRGQTLADAQGDMVMVSEGVRAARMFDEACTNKKIDAPFVRAVVGLLDGGWPVERFLSEVLGSRA